MSLEDSSSYTRIKAAVLKIYELVPEAYRQSFRSLERKVDQTYVELVRDLSTHFKRWLTALDVATFEDLCELMVLEQFKNVLPDRVATYIIERRRVTAADAAVSADEYMLLHKSSFRECRNVLGVRGNVSEATVQEMRSMKVGGFRSGVDNSNTCNYCREEGHWKADCPLFQSRLRDVRPSACAAAVTGCCVAEELPSHSCDLSVLAAYAPFIRGGFVSLLGSEVKVPIKILRDTGAYDSYIVDSVLPLSEETDTGDFVLSRGMGLKILPVPLHKMVLDCALVKGEIAVGVRPALPIEGIHFILGNGLAGSRVWTDTPPAQVVTCCPIDAAFDESSRVLPEVFPSCVFTRAMSRSDPAMSLVDTVEVVSEVPVLAALPVSLSRGEVVEQRGGDSSLREMFKRVLPVSEMNGAVSGYFLQNEMFGGWLPIGEDCGGNEVFHLVVPTGVRCLVLEVAHDRCGHFGSRGALERFRQTLGSLLCGFCAELDVGWEEGLPWLMLAAREAVQESPGFSPSELAFGHSVRGPLAVLRDGCVDTKLPVGLVDYVNGFEHLLFPDGGVAWEKLSVSRGGVKRLYDRRAEQHGFGPGDQVLVLVAIVSSPFQAKCTGPGTVTEKASCHGHRCIEFSTMTVIRLDTDFFIYFFTFFNFLYKTKDNT